MVKMPPAPEIQQSRLSMQIEESESVKTTEPGNPKASSGTTARIFTTVILALADGPYGSL